MAATGTRSQMVIWFPANQALSLLFADSLTALFARRDSLQNMCVYMFTNAFIYVVSHNTKKGSVHGNILLYMCWYFIVCTEVRL